MTVFDDGERRSWTGKAQAYARTYARLCAPGVEAVVEAVGVGDGLRVLDVGTGAGAVAVAALARGARVTAVDAQPDMVALAASAARAADVRVAVLPELPFADGEFDAVVGNFVLNHVGRPRVALAELRRVTRPGGRIALTVWASPAAGGETLLGRAFEASGAVRPAFLPPLSATEDFPRDESGFAALLASAGLSEASCRTLAWDHRVGADDWWSGPAAGVGFFGQVLLAAPASVAAGMREHFDRISAEYLGPDGLLVLPQRALLGTARA